MARLHLWRKNTPRQYWNKIFFSISTYTFEYMSTTFYGRFKYMITWQFYTYCIIWIIIYQLYIYIYIYIWHVAISANTLARQSSPAMIYSSRHWAKLPNLPQKPLLLVKITMSRSRHHLQPPPSPNSSILDPDARMYDAYTYDP